MAADDPLGAEQQFETATRWRQATGNSVSWFETTVEELRQAVEAAEPIIGDWRQDAITLTGLNLRSVLMKVS